MRAERKVATMRKILVVSFISLILAGCMVGPDYQRPTVETPASWRVDEKTAQDLANTAWWRQLDDPVLNELIATAIRQNQDLLIATARVDQFAALYGVVRSDLYPQLGASASSASSRSRKRAAMTCPQAITPSPATSRSF